MFTSVVHSVASFLSFCAHGDFVMYFFCMCGVCHVHTYVVWLVIAVASHGLLGASIHRGVNSLTRSHSGRKMLPSLLQLGVNITFEEVINLSITLHLHDLY